MKHLAKLLILTFVAAGCSSNSNNGGGGGGTPGPSGISSKGSDLFAAQETFDDPTLLEQKGYACGLTQFEHKIDARLRVGTGYEESVTLGSGTNSSATNSTKAVTSIEPSKLVFEGTKLVADAGSLPRKFRETHTCAIENGKNQCRSQTEEIPAALLLQVQELTSQFQASAMAEEDCEPKNVVSTQKFFGGVAKVGSATFKGGRFELTSNFTYVCKDGTSKPGATSIAFVATAEIASSNPTSCNQPVYIWLEQVSGDKTYSLEYRLTGHTR